jgi:hypothetical protein
MNAPDLSSFINLRLTCKAFGDIGVLSAKDYSRFSHKISTASLNAHYNLVRHWGGEEEVTDFKLGQDRANFGELVGDQYRFRDTPVTEIIKLFQTLASQDGCFLSCTVTETEYVGKAKHGSEIIFAKVYQDCTAHLSKPNVPFRVSSKQYAFDKKNGPSVVCLTKLDWTEGHITTNFVYTCYNENKFCGWACSYHPNTNQVTVEHADRKQTTPWMYMWQTSGFFCRPMFDCVMAVAEGHMDERSTWPESIGLKFVGKV